MKCKALRARGTAPWGAVELETHPFQMLLLGLGGNLMADTSLNERLEAVRTLMAMFKAERVAYLLTAIASIILTLVYGAKVLFIKPDPAAIVAVLGSGGFITIAIGRLLTMWRQALRVVVGERVDG